MLLRNAQVNVFLLKPTNKVSDAEDADEYF